MTGCNGYDGVADGKPVEPNDGVRKQEFAVQPLQVLVADGGSDRK
jgi:hypothetical protein